MCTKRHDRLTLDELITLAEEVADENYFRHIPREFIKSAYLTGKTVVSCQHGDVLWINRDYIAYAMLDSPVNYVYATAKHIQSERRDFSHNRRMRVLSHKLPDDIDIAFSIAERRMRDTGLRYWIDEVYLPEDANDDSISGVSDLDASLYENHAGDNFTEENDIGGDV